MDRKDYYIRQYMGAVALMPFSVRNTLASADPEIKASAEEIRLRAGYPVSLKLQNGEKAVSDASVSHQDLNFVLDAATGASAYSAKESIRCGYLPVRGGYRIGICGTAIYTGARVEGFRSISSLAVRIPKEICGAAETVMPKICDKSFRSSLIISPPGYGKTSLLRDIVRLLSLRGMRVSLADERCEVAGMWDGVPQMDIGPMTDVIDSCPKAEALIMLLRAMNPQIVAADEITAPEDVTAFENAANCGVKLLATVHGSSIEDIATKKLYARLLGTGIFEKFIVIDKNSDGRVYMVYDKGETNA